MPSVTPVANTRIQTCPHGLSPGACPVCSGMGGGGMKAKKAEPPKQEMSYNEMVAIWMRIKATRARKEEAKADLQRRAETLQKTRQILTDVMQKLTSALNKIQNILPTPLRNLFQATVNNVLRPIVNLIQKFPTMVKNIGQFIQNIQREIYIVAEKLASVFGEIKNFIQKQVSNSYKKFTKKVYKILNLFGLETGEDFEEDERANTEISVFKAKDVKNLKELILKIIKSRREESDVTRVSKHRS